MVPLLKHYDGGVPDRCEQRTGVDRREIMEFEMTTDLDHLPDSDVLKAYILCYSEEHEFVDKKSPKIVIGGRGGSYIIDITKEEANLYLGMMKGCVKKLRGITDRKELAYQLQVCWKTNDNEVNDIKKFF